MKKRTLFMLIIFSLFGGFALANSGSYFKDLPADHWAYPAVKSLSESGIINGFNDGTFRPNQYVTRAELSQILHKQQEAIQKEFRQVSGSEEDKTINAVANALRSTVVVRASSNQGAGFFVDQKHILTAKHVVGDQKNVKLSLLVGSPFEGEVIATAPKHDLALIRIKGSIEQVKPLKISDSYRVGQTVISIGHPLEFSYTVSKGVISVADRGYEGNRYIQFDNPINLGNSGGPLININGNVVGLVASKVLEFTRSDTKEKESFDGIGLAVRAEEIQEFLKQHQ
ncbi:trypsin-like peptidase domain-containing protein [Ammoniphilus sp. 3BR4]|uniref:trypsin-like peptidase domain-containing protein n=1 Tax=Ammoniphilus sp. 3BR4 TaxID=3158265 RepID=UPI0034659160